MIGGINHDLVQVLPLHLYVRPVGLLSGASGYPKLVALIGVLPVVFHEPGYSFRQPVPGLPQPLRCSSQPVSQLGQPLKVKAAGGG